MSKIIAVINQKGGIGKTTTTYNVAAELATLGKKVLAVDIDPQSSLALSAGYNPLEYEITVYDLFSDKTLKALNAIYKIEDVPGLDIIPSNTTLAKAELELISQMSREHRLKKILDPLQSLYDYIIIDCPSQLGILTLNALVASNYILIPCETSALSYYALDDLKETITGVQEEINSELKVLGIVATMHTNTKTSKHILSQLEQYEYPLLGVCKRTVAAQRGMESGLPVVINEPSTELAIAYKDITKKILEEVE